MTNRTMLVHVDESAHCASRVAAAIALARDMEARLIGAYLVPTGDMPPSLAAVLPRDLVEKRMREAAEAQKTAEHAFRDAAVRGELHDIEWRAPAGDPLRALIAHGRCTDLVVLGQRDPGDPRMLFGEQLLASALFELGRPIMIVPYIGAQRTLGKRILIATNGSREAARAIGDAMPLLERSVHVRVLIGTPDDPDRSPTFAQTSVRIAGWLHDHGVEPAIERYDAEPGDRGEWLLSRAADDGIDLIVIGGYGHPRLREMVLGGVTQTILRAMTVPVLMSH
jgi:nucleotide-binding universal stress UspA family protein